jgi:putative transposase
VEGAKKELDQRELEERYYWKRVSVVKVCEAVEMSAQNYYVQQRARERERVEKEKILSWVGAVRKEHPRMGGRKLWKVLQRKHGEEMTLGRDRLFVLLAESDLLVKRLPRQYVQTTNSNHSYRVYGNVFKDAELKRPNEAWVSDLTYIPTKEGFVYLALVTDAVSRKIVGYHCGETLEAIGCVRALEMAFKTLPPGARPIHHSDRGTQYCSNEYIKRLVERELRVSMTEKNHCAENALAERMNGILKNEYGLCYGFPTRELARAAVREVVRLYNGSRPHMELDYRCPDEVHSLAE